MSLKNLVDGAVAAVASLGPDEPSSAAALRDPVLRQIDAVEDRWSRREAGAAGGWYHQDADHVAFTPVLGNGAALTIGGQTTTFVPVDKFADFLVNMREQVTAGAFDREIEAGRFMAHVRDMIDKTAAAMPTHEDFIARHCVAPLRQPA